MKLLKCKICMGEVDLIGTERSINRKTKCRSCGLTNDSPKETTRTADVEVITIHRRRSPDSL
jgi:uncharacterized Zn finger protein